MMPGSSGSASSSNARPERLLERHRQSGHHGEPCRQLGGSCCFAPGRWEARMSSWLTTQSMAPAAPPAPAGRCRPRWRQRRRPGRPAARPARWPGRPGPPAPGPAPRMNMALATIQPSGMFCRAMPGSCRGRRRRPRRHHGQAFGDVMAKLPPPPGRPRGRAPQGRYVADGFDVGVGQARREPA